MECSYRRANCRVQLCIARTRQHIQGEPPDPDAGRARAGALSPRSPGSRFLQIADQDAHPALGPCRFAMDLPLNCDDQLGLAGGPEGRLRTASLLPTSVEDQDHFARVVAEGSQEGQTCLSQ